MGESLRAKRARLAEEKKKQDEAAVASAGDLGKKAVVAEAEVVVLKTQAVPRT